MYGLQITFVFNNVFPEDNYVGSKHVEGITKQSKGLIDYVECILKVCFGTFSIFFLAVCPNTYCTLCHVLSNG